MLRSGIRRAAKRAALHVVPHEDNGHVPHVLRGRYLLAAGAVAIVTFAGIAWGIPASQERNLTAEVYSSVLVDLTNDAREARDVGALTVSPTLERAAELKARDMARKGYFAHTSPEGLSPWHWLDEAGYGFVYAGENLAVHFEDTEDVQEALYASPTHRANILDGRFTEIGIATARGTYQGAKTTFVVEMFGTPAKVAAAPAPEPAAARAAEEPASAPAGAPATVLGETAPEPAATPAPEAAPVAVVYEDQQVAIAENTSPEVHLAAVAPAATVAPAAAATEPVRLSSWQERFLMNPGPAAISLYILLAALVAFGTATVLLHEVARKNRRRVAYGAGFVLFVLTLAAIGQKYAFASLSVL